MDAATLRDGLARVNDRIASATRSERVGKATFVCECGRCGGTFVPISLTTFDEMRARDQPVLAPGHR